MSQRDDIEFDFFEEPATQETAPRRRGGDGPSGRPPRRPPIRPPANIGSLSRLVGLVAAAIFVVILLVFWIQGCRSDSKRDAYRGYMTDIGQIAEDSEQVGRQLNTLLTTPGIRQQQLQSRLDQLAQQQLQGVTRARELSPPGPLRDEHLQAVIALEERTVGLRRLQDAFQQTASAQNADREELTGLLATQMRRFVASDVMWEDLFRVPSVATIVLSSRVCSTWPLGSARVCTRLLPCRPVGVPPVEAPRIRSRTGAIARAVARSGVVRNTDCGTSTPAMPSCRSVATDGTRNRSSHITSLATKRRICVARSSPASSRSAFCADAVCWNAS